MRLLCDSGATSCCIGTTCPLLPKLIAAVTNKSPGFGVKVGDAVTLPCRQIVTLSFRGDLALGCFKLLANGKRVSVRGELDCHSVLVVEGLDPNIILLSVLQLRKLDGVLVYFNSDNKYAVDNCIRLPNGLFSTLQTSRGAYELTFAGELNAALTAGVELDHLDPLGHDDAFHDRTTRDLLRVHAALGHVGATTLALCNIRVSGARPRPLKEPHECKGCRLSARPRGYRHAPAADGPGHGPARAHAPGPAGRLTPAEYFGHQVSSDCCVSLPRSWPHGFTVMVNFVDAFTREKSVFFTLGKTHCEIASALEEYVKRHEDRLKCGKVTNWQTDNGKEFRGADIDGEGGVARELTINRLYSIPNESNMNAAAERHFGVVENAVRRALAHAGAPPCLWTWAANQYCLLAYYIATRSHSPPKSPHDFVNPGRDPADLSWARVLFCNVLVSIPGRDVENKVSYRAADGCHLGWDVARRGHLVYVPSLGRLSSFRIISWCGEDKFNIAQAITSDTPHEYHQVDDLKTGQITRELLPGSFRRPRAPARVAAAAALEQPTKLIPLPTTLAEAKASHLWPLVQDAMELEIKGKFINNEAWDVVAREPNMRVIRTKWVFKFTVLDDRSISKVKARLVACGYGQREGVDFTEVFESTLASTSLRILCAMIAAEDLETDQIDAYKAFTQADVDADIYAEMPPSFTRPGHVIKLKKALEGIKQGAFLWFNRNKDALEKLGFQCTHAEPNLYRHALLHIIIGVFADDVLAAYDAAIRAQYERVKLEYSTYIKIEHLKIVPVALFCGIEIERDRARKTLTICQSRYITLAFEEYKSQGAREISNPYGSTAEREAFEKLQPAAEGDRIDTTKMLKICGKLVWAASMTRPDITYAVGVLCSFGQTAGPAHYAAALRVLGYLHKTRDIGITYGGNLKMPLGLAAPPEHFHECNGLHAYYDSSWGKAPHPWGGYVVMYGNGATAWKASKAKIMPDSTAEAETAVGSKAAKETTVVRSVVADMGRPVAAPTPLLGDSQAARDIIVRPGATARTRHFERSVMLIKRLYLLRVVDPFLVGTKFMVADIFTKALEPTAFFLFRDYLLNLQSGPGCRVTLHGQAARLWKNLLLYSAEQDERSCR